jgi:hypothetical protein
LIDEADACQRVRLIRPRRMPGFALAIRETTRSMLRPPGDR